MEIDFDSKNNCPKIELSHNMANLSLHTEELSLVSLSEDKEVKIPEMDTEMVSKVDDINSEKNWFEFDPQINNETHVARFAFFLESGIESDITLIVGEDKKPIRAHKLILMIGSPVLRYMLHQIGDAKTFDIPGIEYHDFMLFLKFLYTGQLPVTICSALALLQLSDVYEIPDLAQACEKLLETHITNETAIKIYEQAILYRNVFLWNAAMTHICKNAAVIVESQEFIQMKPATLANILEKDSLEVLDEIQLFDATMRWAHAECSRQKVVITSKYMRSVLENFIGLIRFPQISPADFSLKVATAQVLTTEEVVSILLYFNVPKSQRHSISPGLFNPRPRNYYQPKGEVFILMRLHFPHKTTAEWYGCTSSGQWGSMPGIPMTNTSHCIDFKVDTPLWIQSVGLNAVSQSVEQQQNNTKCENHVQLKIKIEDCTEKIVIAKKIFSFSNYLTSTLQQIQFDKPARIQNEKWYRASFKIISGIYIGMRYESIGNGNIFRLDCGGKEVHFHFQDVESSTSLTNTKQGYIPEFGFQIE